MVWLLAPVKRAASVSRLPKWAQVISAAELVVVPVAPTTGIVLPGAANEPASSVERWPALADQRVKRIATALLL
jgi:hypothetical protein